jgi:hypothetical protein
MDKVTRVRQASIKVAKLQRRMWLFQAVIGPLLIGCLVIAAVVGIWAVRRRNAVATASDGTEPPPPVEIRPSGGAQRD